jgi:SecD/SecF fusion protein
MEILPPNYVCTETYIVVDALNTQQEAENLLGYLKTHFARFLVAQITSTQHISKSSFSLLPIQDFTESWNDKKLYAKYGLSLEEIDSEVIPVISDVIGGGAIQTQKVQGTNEVIIKTKTLEVAQREAINQALEDKFAIDTEKITTETISSTVSNEMRSDALLAVVVATICMLIYIWFRFKDVRFAASSVLALVHDVLVVLAFYAIAKVSVGSTFIACMLTIVGYSINATIVIFDRVRENLSLAGFKEDLQTTVNKSINQTLSRSIFTSLTTFIMVAALYVFGVTSIREFALPIMVGIICGTYSSVCLTGAMWYVFRAKFAKKKAKN